MSVYVTRWLIAVTTAFTLAGCFQAEVAGPVGGATVTVTDLRTGAQVLDPVTTADQAEIIEREGQRAWNNYNDLQRFINLGNFFLDAGSLANNRYYLITVAGGQDTDADADGEVDQSATPVGGEWHAIIRGSDLKEGGFKVSVLTEALYQVVLGELPQLSNDAIKARLDELAQTIITDTTDDGAVDYTDVLNWTVLFHEDNYQLDFADVRALQELILAGNGDVSAASFGVIGERPLDALTFFEEKISNQIIQARCVNCHVSGGVAGGSNLVFQRNNSANHVESNHQVFVRLAAVRSDVVDFVTTRAQGGAGHRGGVQLRPGSQDLVNLEAYLGLL